MAKHLNVPEAIAEEFQSRYFDAFPGVKRWHLAIQRELQSGGKLTTALGRERVFFGRLDSRETLKEAIAWLPQSLISDILKIGMLYVWRKFEIEKRWAMLHADMHDGMLMSIKEPRLDEIAPQIKRLMTIPIQFPSGVMTIPVDLTVGYQWQKKKKPDDGKNCCRMHDWEPGILSKLTRPELKGLLDIEASLVEKAG